MIEIAQNRPPYVEFKRVPEEDREASIKAGHIVFKDVPYVELTPAGSKDKLIKRADDWLAQIRAQAAEGRMPKEWVRDYAGAFEEWEKGNEIPVNGTSIRNWPVASPAEIENCIRLNLRAVEDLAVANEEAIMRLGMGGRALKQRAIDWLQSASSAGKVTQEMTSLRAENDALKTRNSALEQRLAKLEAAAGK